MKGWYNLIKGRADEAEEYVVDCCKNVFEHIGFTEISVEEDGTYNGTFEGFRYYGLIIYAPFVTQFFEEHSLNIKFREKIPVKEIQPKKEGIISKVSLEFELLHANLKGNDYANRDTEPE